MLFGEKETFAIEAESQPTLWSAFCGRMQIWCQGVSLGDYSDPYCVLYAGHWRDLGERLPALWKPEFAEMSDLELLEAFEWIIYGCRNGELAVGDEDDESLDDWNEDEFRAYYPHSILTNWGEQFDNTGLCFIVCTPEQQVRILTRALPPGRGLALETTLSEVQYAIDDYLSWFEKQAASTTFTGLPESYKNLVRSIEDFEYIKGRFFADDDLLVSWFFWGLWRLGETTHIEGAPDRPAWNVLASFAEIDRGVRHRVSAPSDSGEIPLERLESSVAVAEENGDYLYLDSVDGYSVWVYLHDSGEVCKVADSFDEWLSTAIRTESRKPADDS